MRTARVETSGSEALQLVDRYQPDMVLMDISMPGIDGIEATRGIIAKHPATTVVVFTSHAGSARIVDAPEAGASDFILKDTDPFEIPCPAPLHGAARGPWSRWRGVAHRGRLRHAFHRPVAERRRVGVVTHRCSNRRHATRR
jgi:DNA-binding NarL/FixJ family response regulator